MLCMILARDSFFFPLRFIKNEFNKANKEKKLITAFLGFHIMHITRSRSKITVSTGRAEIWHVWAILNMFFLPPFIPSPATPNLFFTGNRRFILQWPQFRDQNALRSWWKWNLPNLSLTNAFFSSSFSWETQAGKKRTITLHRHRA